MTQVYKEMCERSGARAGQKRTHTLNEQGTQTTQWNSQQQSAGRYEGSSGTASTSGQLKVDGLIKKVCVVPTTIAEEMLTFRRRSP
jgi:hypothetical protein